MSGLRIDWRRGVAGVLLCLAVPWLLRHAIQFWTLYTTGGWPGWGPALWVETWHGWVPPVAAELVALWGWSQAGWARRGPRPGDLSADPRQWSRLPWQYPNGWAVAGLVASVLLVVGPLYVVTDPVLRELAAPRLEAAESGQVADLRAQIARKAKVLEGHLAAGATGNARKTDQELDALSAQLRARQDAEAAAQRARAGALDWRRHLILGLQLALIVLLQVMAAVAYRVAFGRRDGRNRVHFAETVRKDLDAPSWRPARMVLCPQCGNKRCPHAADPANACTGSNEPGQPGSNFPAPPANGTDPERARVQALKREVNQRWPGVPFRKIEEAGGPKARDLSLLKNWEDKRDHPDTPAALNRIEAALGSGGER